MLLKKIVLTNFRQFYGTQELEIAGDSDKNVTLIHAENGVGKTTVLNAILWCFYKETTPRFEQPDKIANQQAISEGNYTFKVEVLFENENEEYLVTRECDERNGEDLPLKAFVVNNGNYKPLSNPAAFVDSVIPREMAKYFFFDGEYAETFSSQKNKLMVRDALEDMLGCRTANSAIRDLESLKVDFEKRLALLANNDHAAAFQQKIDILTAQNEKGQAELVHLETNLATAESARKEIIYKLRGAAAASSIQKNREEFERELCGVVATKAKQESELTSWINDGGIGLIAKQLEEKTHAMLQNATLKGKIPSYIAETFVQDILSKKLCICDRPFEEHSREAEAISNLFQDAGNALATDRLMNARALMAKLSEKRSKALQNLTRIKESIEATSNKINSLESKIENCSAELRGSDVKEIAEREAALEARHKEIKDLNSRIELIKFSENNNQIIIEENKVKRDKLMASNERAIPLQKRIALLAKTSVRIKEELKKYREDSREAIAVDVNAILEKTARRDYYATIDEKFNLDMHYKSSRLSVAKGGGENQLLSLAFIAALIKFSANRMEDNSTILKPGTTAPLVLDSPFGQEDPTYQKSTAEFLPKLARQVVLLLSKSQGNPDVLQALKGKIGREYILISENIESQGDKPSDNININGKDYASSRYNCEKTLTRIKAV